MVSSARAAAGFLLFLRLLLEAVLEQPIWFVTYHQPVNICAVRGSTVSISFSVSHASHNNYQKSLRYIATEEINGRRVKVYSQPCINKICALTISNVTESNSAEYKFTFIKESFSDSDNPVHLKVSDLQVNVRGFYRDPGPYRLSCDTQCHLTGQQNFTWYMNDQPVGYEQTIDLQTINPGAQYTCRVSGSAVPSPAVYAPRTPTVSINSSHNMVEGDLVNLTCHSDANPPATYSWFKGKQDLQHYQPELIIQSVLSSDSGEYHCRAENLLGEATTVPSVIMTEGKSDFGTMNIIRLTLVVLLLSALLMLILWNRRKQKTRSSCRKARAATEMIEMDASVFYENVSEGASGHG